MYRGGARRVRWGLGVGFLNFFWRRGDGGLVSGEWVDFLEEETRWCV